MIANLIAFGFVVTLILCGKWILAGIAILTGNKDALHEVGNLCKDEPPKYDYRKAYWLKRWAEEDEEWRRRGEGNMF